VNLILSLALLGSLWETDSLGEFRQGEFSNVSLSSAPELLLAPELAGLAATSELLVLSLAVDSKGQVYCGTGSEGRVYRISGNRAESLFALSTGQVLSLACDRSDNVYCGTAPDGIIYRIAGGKAEKYFATGQKYVWALAFDDAGGLYAGTGDSGIIYRITAADKGTVAYDAPEPHITALAWDKALYAGSSGSGLVYRINGDRAQVLYKTARPEVRSLAVGPGGVVYAAANPDQEKDSDSKPLVYRIRPDGNAATIFTPRDSIIYAVVRSGKELLVGTGGKARLYQVNTDTADQDFGLDELILEAREGQILALAQGANSGLFIGTGNSGKVYRRESNRVREGTFTSRVFDAGAVSRWGRCFWTGRTPGGTSIHVSTRTGSSDKPDDTWSGWDDLRDEQVASPSARFIQYRVKLLTGNGGATPALSKLTIAYARTNLAPVLKVVQVKPSDDADRRQDRVINWDASDPNDDSLAVTVLLKGTDESGWLTLVKDKTGLTKYTLAGDRVPDGWYQARVLVSDKASNPAGQALSAERVSAKFVIDNTPPAVGDMAVTRLAGNRYRLSFSARDELSLLSRSDVSVNLKDWQPAGTENGIFDARSARLMTEIELEPGENVITVRVLDQFGNTGTARKVLVAE
jgi:hypothetical protein